jgi:enterobacterial common antigen flippase
MGNNEGESINHQSNANDEVVVATPSTMTGSLSRTEAPCPSPAAPANPSGETASERRSTYGQILKSSALIGGSSVLNIALGIVRTKAMAVLLGPAGVGLMGIYNSILDLARTLAGMGVNGSAVRQIAEASGTGDSRQVARTVTALRRVVLGLSVGGALVLMASSVLVSRISFGDRTHASAVALLAVALFFATLSSGQTALLQGVRRIADLARANVLGGLLGTISSVLIVVWLGSQGIVPAVVSVAAMTGLASWWYSRRVQVEACRLNFTQLSSEASSLLKLGVVFMASGFMMMGVAYFVRIIVLRTMGEDAAGFYQAAWTLGGLYVGFILQSMGADFFPRLTAAAQDHEECNRLVNEQAEISLLLAGPGIIGTLALAPLVIDVFYSGKFEPAVEILRWICLGMMLRVASWPMGFIVLAKGARQPFFWTELASNLVQVLMVWAGVSTFGLNGTGMAFFGGYLFYWFLIYAIVRKMSGFRWSLENKQIGTVYGLLILVVFVAWYWIPGWATSLGGGIVALIAGIQSLRKLCRLVPLTRLPKLLQRVLVILKIAPEQ